MATAGGPSILGRMLVTDMTIDRATPLAAVVSVRSLRSAAIAGAVGLAVWEIFARLVAPLWIGHALEPAGLVEAAFGIGGTGAELVHILTGLVVFPLGYVFGVHPVLAHLAGGVRWWLAGILYGLALWVVALFGIAHLVAGFPPFLDFAPIAWASLVGHLLLGLGVAGTVARIDSR